MKCETCGMEIPDTGIICPYCKELRPGAKRELKKSSVKMLVVIIAAILVGALIGVVVGGSPMAPAIGALIGGFVSVPVAIFVGRDKKSGGRVG